MSGATKLQGSTSLIFNIENWVKVEYEKKSVKILLMNLSDVEMKDP